MILMVRAREVSYTPQASYNSMALTTTPRELSPIYLARIWKQGTNCVFPLPKLLLKLLGARPGQKVIIRVHSPYVTFRVLHPDDVIPVGAFTTAELPPAVPRPVRAAPGGPAVS